MKTLHHPLSIAAVFIWVGFVSAISFMEAWLKFRAPGLTMATGLCIGRLVFHALNIMEWIFAVIVAFDLLRNASLWPTRTKMAYFICLLVLLLQSFWLLPALDHRVELYQQSLPVRPSSLHLIYVLTECIKVTALLALGALFFKQNK